MPINTGHGHWVSMMISKDNDTNKIIFTYNDPLGRSLNDRPDLVRLITEVCSDAEIMDLKTQQQEEGNTSDCGVLVCDDLIRQSQAETLKQSLIAQQAQEQHVYINIDSNASDNEEDKDNNVNSNEVERPPYDNNDEVEVGGATMQLNY
ncbi:hypothetical protein [Rickettsia montanensis]|nr:hypothetical protein [Rickettsia montanensis]